jgi:hypothetical protein
VYNQEYSLGERQKRQKRLTFYAKCRRKLERKQTKNQRTNFSTKEEDKEEEFFFSSFVEQRASTKKKIKHL